MGYSRGQVRHMGAYTQAKLLVSDTWDLPAFITPSDIDLVFDNRGHFLACEFARHESSWHELKRGQREVYEALAKKGCLTALCKHSVPIPEIPPMRLINTRDDVETVEFMWWDALEGKMKFHRGDNRYWVDAIEKDFYADRK